MKDKVSMFIVISVVTVYLYLVIEKIAAVEGFCVLATYIIKKFLDALDDGAGGPPVQPA